MPAEFVVERTPHRRFPFRVTIQQNGAAILAVRAQSSWPGPGQQIFCLRERELDPEEPLELVERVGIAHLGRVGRKLTLVLDRPIRKRCEFLVVRKQSGTGGRAYEQIFFRTESGIRAHRSRTRMELLPTAVPHVTVAVDSAERYPWRFPGATVLRRKLAAGDYALLVDAKPAAVVERKTFDNLLTDIGALQALHHQLEDLASLPCAALVIEAQYGDFLDEHRLAGRWPPAHVARVLAELAALHPRLPIVFAGNRKHANAWCARFFAACAGREESPQLDLVRETISRYEVGPRDGGLDEGIRQAVRASASGVALRELVATFPDAPASRVRRVLAQMEEEGSAVRRGRGPGTRWHPGS